MSLERLPRDILAFITSFLATHRFLGPPSDLVPLILTSRAMHDALCSCRDRNAYIYSAIYDEKFDSGAVHRRMGSAFATSMARSSELRYRFPCIRRIRQRRYDTYPLTVLVNDLCCSFFMLLGQ